MDIERKGVTEAQEPEMRDHYDFTGGERGKYAHLFPQKAHIVVLSPDLVTAFPNSDSVNEALRSLVKIARQSVALEPVQEPETPAATPPGASPSA